MAINPQEFSELVDALAKVKMNQQKYSKNMYEIATAIAGFRAMYDNQKPSLDKIDALTGTSYSADALTHLLELEGLPSEIMTFMDPLAAELDKI